MSDDHPALPPQIEALWARLDKQERDRFMAFVLRIRNNDAKAHRLAALRAEGKISLHQLLERM